jgi:Spx/MgsR family transcriptional regulator
LSQAARGRGRRHGIIDCMSAILYGIPNCDTVKKARAWLADQGVVYAFHDFKKQGVPPERLAAWMEQVGWEKLLNRSGTTWRRLDDAARASAADARGARELMLAQPSVIKRPVVEWPHGVTTVGFDSAAWALLARR